jgi:sortase A
MTVTTTRSSSGDAAAPSRNRLPWRSRRPATVWVEASPGAQATSLLLAMICGVILFLLINLAFVSQLEHYTTQKALYSQLRLTLAEGSTPVAPLSSRGKLAALGAPVAVMQFPTVGIGQEVVVEGTTGAQTMDGIGHRRDSVLPCQTGTSVLMARAGSYGAVGAAWAQLSPGDTFTVTMGQGSCTYQVMDHRNAGDKAPPAPVDKEGRVVLTTASGAPFMPTDVLRIDAKLTTDSFARSGNVFPQGSLPDSEAAMGADASQLFGLLLLLEVLVALALAGTWLWRRWGRWQTWIVITPLALAFGLLAATNLNYLLPNLL